MSFKNFAYGFTFIFYRNKAKHKAPLSKPNEDLTPCERAALDQIKLNVKATKSELSAKLGKSEKTIQRLQSSLIEKGCLRRIGSNQYGYWEILQP